MCSITVQVPPEADLQGVRTVAVVAADLPADASVVSGNTIRWQGLLEAGRRLDLVCVPTRGTTVSGRIVAETSPASVDPRLVRDVIDGLGRRLAGDARKELRPIQTPPPSPAPAPDP